MLLSLPVDVICEAIFGYLSFGDIKRLDIAFTNRDLRPELCGIWQRYCTKNLRHIYGKHVYITMVGRDVVEITIDEDGELDLQQLTERFRCCPRLRKLYVDLSSKVILTEDTLFDLARHCPHLEVLSMVKTEHRCADDGLIAVAQHCHKLHTIELHSNITDSVIQALCDYCPHLRHIDLLLCFQLTDKSLIAIANAYPHLKSLSLNALEFSGSAIETLADKCHELEKVILYAVSYHKHSFAKLWKANPKILSFGLCSSTFTDDFVVSFAQSCHKVRVVHLGQCRGITDVSLIALGQHCHELQDLSLKHTDTKGITEAGVEALVAGCPWLYYFSTRDRRLKASFERLSLKGQISN